jgi:alkylated DNA repair dioxygenase AlkB
MKDQIKSSDEFKKLTDGSRVYLSYGMLDADNEKELGKNPIIASVSFGSERVFQLKHNSIPGLKQNILLEHGSLLVMKGTTQHFWKHQIPKTSKLIGSRINLTFRIIK